MTSKRFLGFMVGIAMIIGILIFLYWFIETFG